MERTVIAVDLDEVAADTLPAFLAFYNSVYGREILYQEFVSSDWAPCLQISQMQLSALIEEFIQSSFYDQLVPTTDALEILSILQNDFVLHAVTSRWGALANSTESWINTHLPNIFADVHYSQTSNLVQSGTSQQQKSEICTGLGARLIIEDCPRHAHACLSKDIPVILFDRPWNKTFSAPNISRVRSWRDVPTAVSTLLNINKGTEC